MKNFELQNIKNKPKTNIGAKVKGNLSYKDYKFVSVRILYKFNYKANLAYKD